ncbi:hypothetical protein EC968_009508, partial [Mortierella alpina]
MSNPRLPRGGPNSNIPSPISNSGASRRPGALGSASNPNTGSAGNPNIGSAGDPNPNFGSAPNANLGSAENVNLGSTHFTDLGSADQSNFGPAISDIPATSATPANLTAAANLATPANLGTSANLGTGAIDPDRGLAFNSDHESRAEWAIAIEEQCNSLRDDMSAMETRILRAVANAIGVTIGNHNRPTETHDPGRMRTPRPLVAESSEDEILELNNNRSSTRPSRNFRRQENRAPYYDRPGNNLDENIDVHRRTLERLKSYDGPTFVLSRKKGKHADDWIRGFDNWFRARVCDPNIDDDIIRTGVIRLVMFAVSKHTEASEWCRNRIREPNTTYHELMEDLSDTFMDLDEARRRIKVEFLQETPQTANERIVQYNVRFKARVDLHRAACARARRTPDERSLLSSYAGGLYDRNHGYIAGRQGNWEAAMRHMKEIGSRYNEVELARKSSRTTQEPDTEVSGNSEVDSASDSEIATKTKDRSKSTKDAGQWETMQDTLKKVTDKMGTLTLLL